MSLNGNKRLGYIDCAKGIGILLVIIGHHLLGAPLVVKWIQSFHMPLFFIISGVLFSYNGKPIPFSQLLRKKARTLMYPYLTFSFISLIWYTIFYIILPFVPEFSFRSVLIRTITTYGHNALWFLPTMFWCAILFPTLFFSRHPYWLGLLLVAFSVICSNIVSHDILPVVFSKSINYVGRISLSLTFMLFGSMLPKVMVRLAKLPRIMLISFSAVFSFFLFNQNCYVNFTLLSSGNPLLFYLCACSGSILVLTLSHVLVSHSKSLAYFGKNSLPIMAIHMDAPIQIAWMLLGITSLSTRFSPAGTSIIAILIESIVCLIFVFIINKYFPFLLTPPNVNAKNVSI